MPRRHKSVRKDSGSASAPARKRVVGRGVSDGRNHENAVEYLADVLPELRALAVGADQAFIAYLLEMASMEAQEQLRATARRMARGDLRS